MDYKVEVAKQLSKKIDFLSVDEIEAILEVPKDREMGDYAFPCFRLAKTFRKAPPMIAQELVNDFEVQAPLAKVEAVGGYLNFTLDKTGVIKSVLEAVMEKGAKYGSKELGHGKNVVIDFSAPNIAKPFHVGHLRSTVIGNSLYKIYEFEGYNAIGINHLGDWGKQFGMLIAAYKHWGDDKALEEEPIKALLDLYVKIHAELDEHPEYEVEGRAWFKSLEDGDEEAQRLWKWFVELSMVEFNRIYEILGVSFDHFTGESFYNDKMEPVVAEIKEKNLLVESDGAYVVDLGEEMPPCIILKRDGATIYATRDITAALYRKKTFDFEKCIYITDYAQDLHFQQWFKVIELMGYEWAGDLMHESFGRVSTEQGKLATRKGNVILLDDLLSQSIGKVQSIIDERNPDLENKEEVAKAVGIGAVIFNDLSNNKNRDIVFNWERMLSFEGETGPYVQYSHARACSVLRKSGLEGYAEFIHYDLLLDPSSLDVIQELAEFPDAVEQAMLRNEPSIITRKVILIAQRFNKFYHDCPILVDDQGVKESRLALVLAVKTVLETGLNLLGIKAPEKM
jgi:arginyl-tRNA synthetase